jgi:[ribosomal protein S5]-alanine N-acetyltransferase
MVDDRESTLTRFPTIDGRIVKLRELTIGDATDISQLITYKVSKFLWEVPYPYTLENALSFIDSSHKEFRSLKTINFAILFKDNIEYSGLVGIIGLKNINIHDRKANLGYWIGESFWGNGIASESVKLVINYAFSILKLEEVYAYVYSHNKSSIRVLEKNNMTRIGEVNEYSKKLDRFQSSIKFFVKRQ